MIILKLLIILILMELELQLNDIDYEDIYDNIDDYEYPYNHINRSITLTHARTRTHMFI